MTGNKSLFSTYQKCDGGNVTFGSKAKIKIIGKGTISHDSLTIDDVAHVDNLGFNLLSISQLCRNKYNVLFSENGIKILKDGITIAKGVLKNNVYVMKLDQSSRDKLCLASLDESSTLWHRRLGHANMRLIQNSPPKT